MAIGDRKTVKLTIPVHLEQVAEHVERAALITNTQGDIYRLVSVALGESMPPDAEPLETFSTDRPGTILLLRVAEKVIARIISDMETAAAEDAKAAKRSGLRIVR